MRNHKKRLKRSLFTRFSRELSSKRGRIFLVLLLIFIPVVTFGVGKWRAQALPCPCNIFTTDPSVATDTQPGGIEVGFKFRSSTAGYISGIRFYKNSDMTGAHTVSLWNNNGSARLAQVVSTSETASGWQEVNFTPVPINANTIYTASVFMADGKFVGTGGYFQGNTVVNPPLTAPENGQAIDGNGIGQNGVFNASGSSAYPTSFFNGANYWVDVTFSGSPDGNPPVVDSVTPTDSATGVNIGKTLSATFNSVMDAASLTTSTFTVKDDQNTAVPGVVSYNSANRTASFVANEGFDANKTYTATLEGGTGTVVKNLDDVAMAADYSWSFTTGTSNGCPCTLKDNMAPVGSGTAVEGGSVEVGVKVTPQSNGYITALRFYKPILNTETSHTGQVWSSTGTSLASVTFSNETEYGWQEAKLSSPLRVNEGQLYIISYGSSQVVYQSTAGGVNSNLGSGSLIAYADNDARNAATGSGNRNGVFSTTAGTYPSSGSTAGNYYWVDAVFSNTSTVSNPVQVNLTQPKNNAYGAVANKPITATFNQAIDPLTVGGSSFQVFDANNSQVTGTVSYNEDKREASFTPTGGSFTNGQKYTAKLSTSIANPTGDGLASEYSWSFSVGSPITSSADINEGPGGPVLVVTSTGNNFSKYYAEILRTEGLNYFEVADIADVTTASLANYDAVVLSEMSLTQPQADMFDAWVNGGGNLLAMRPDKKLAGLLGLTDASSTRSNQYLKVETGAAPGQGIVSDSVQFKGTADNYTTNGATVVANLYSDASTNTSNPAVTTKSVGSSGGTAMAFAYDLAKSVVAMHQGNQAWTGQERDGIFGVRPSDMFYGAMTGDIQPDWVDMNKIHIPQADEQQRLMANMLTEATKDKKPLPRLWYLPNDHKAALVLSGDDHNQPANVGTERVMNNWLNESTTNCSVIDWECVRASNYIYTATPLSNAQAVQYQSYGHEIGNHPSNAGSCNAFTSYAQLAGLFTSDLTAFRAKYTGLPDQTTNRFHCYLWNDWDSMSKAANANGMRYILDYVAFPGSWINGKSPLITGSGMNMRFTDATGNMMDTRQGVTNFDNTAANSTAINAALDNAIGSTGYYGIFGSHYEMSDNYHQTLKAAATSRNIPTITSAQALEWLDGRDSSNFEDFDGENGQFTFTLNTAEGAHGLRAMMPMADAGGTLTDIKLGSSAVTYQTQTIKGVQYAVFDGNPGNYTVTYSDYDPNAGGGGTNPGTDPGTGTGGSSGSAGGISGTGSGKKNSKKSGSIFNGTAPDAVAVVPGDVPQDDSQPSQNPDTSNNNNSPEKEFIQNDDSQKTSSWAWLWWLLIVLVISGALWWFIAAKRRKRKQEQQWQ